MTNRQGALPPAPRPLPSRGSLLRTTAPHSVNAGTAILLRIAAIAVFGLTTRYAGAAPIACPASLPSAGTGFEQVGAAPTAPTDLDTMRLFDGPPGEEQRPSPAELAPDSSGEKGGNLTNTWIFAGNEKLLLVCAYRGTKTYYRTLVPRLPKTCTLHRGAHRTTGACL